MKVLIIFAVISMFIGCRERRFNVRGAGLIFLIVGTVVAFQTINIVFRHIGVD